MATSSELGVVGADEPQSQGLILGGAVGRSRNRQRWSLVGQYALLCVLAAVVLSPLLLVVMQALSPTGRYVNAGAPKHPVAVDWKDRTWFTGGWISVGARTAVLLLVLVALQRVGAGIRDRREQPRWAPSGRIVGMAIGWLGALLLVHQVVLAIVDLARDTDLRDGMLGDVLRWAAIPGLAVLAWLAAAAIVTAAAAMIEALGPIRLACALAGTVVVAVAAGPTFQSLREADGVSEWWILGTMLLLAATQFPGYLIGLRHSPTTAAFVAAATGFLVAGSAILFVGPSVWTASWGRYSLGEAMGRSLVMALIITGLQVVTSIMAAYAFVFLRFPLKRTLFAVFLATLLLPLEVTLVGNIETIRRLEWIDSMPALVLPFGATALGTFLIRQGFRGLPGEIRDATRLDGYGHLAFLTKFAVPLTRPVIASFTVISALQAWNQYLWPRSVITDNDFNTLQIQLRAAAAVEVNAANQAIGAALVAAVPVAIVLVLFQRQIIRGLTAGAVK